MMDRVDGMAGFSSFLPTRSIGTFGQRGNNAHPKQRIFGRLRRSRGFTPPNVVEIRMRLCKLMHFLTYLPQNFPEPFVQSRQVRLIEAM